MWDPHTTHGVSPLPVGMEDSDPIKQVRLAQEMGYGAISFTSRVVLQYISKIQFNLHFTEVLNQLPSLSLPLMAPSWCAYTGPAAVLPFGVSIWVFCGGLLTDNLTGTQKDRTATGSLWYIGACMVFLWAATEFTQNSMR